MNKYERWRIEKQEPDSFVSDLYPAFYEYTSSLSCYNFNFIYSDTHIIYLGTDEPEYNESLANEAVRQNNSIKDALHADIQYVIGSLINNDKSEYQFVSIGKECISDYYVQTKKYLHDFVKINHVPKVRSFIKGALDFLLFRIENIKFVVYDGPRQ
jgi:hypothetical protein